MKDENGVAAVLGHEISHTVAKHTAERASRGFIVVGIALLLSAFIDVSQQLSGLLLSLGYEMPNTRVQEACCLSLDADFFANTVARRRRTILDCVGYTYRLFIGSVVDRLQL